MLLVMLAIGPVLPYRCALGLGTAWCVHFDGADLQERFERVEFIPMFDKPSVLHAPYIYGPHGNCRAGRRTTHERAHVGSLVTIATDNLVAASRNDDVLRGDPEVGNSL